MNHRSEMTAPPPPPPSGKPASVTGEQAAANERTSRFRRSKNGKTIHAVGCHLAAAAVPWRWADDKSNHEVATTILYTAWLRPCKRCMGFMADFL